MSAFTFTPDKIDDTLDAPYFEEAKADIAPYYSSTLSIENVKVEIGILIGRLGGEAAVFKAGYFGPATKRRYGYHLEFQMAGMPARMTVAGLPILHKETPNKIEGVKRQALLIVRDWLKSAVTSHVFAPGGNPLVQFLLVDGNRTLVEVMVEDKKIPLLTSKTEVKS